MYQPVIATGVHFQLFHGWTAHRNGFIRTLFPAIVGADNCPHRVVLIDASGFQVWSMVISGVSPSITFSSTRPMDEAGLKNTTCRFTSWSENLRNADRC